MSVYCMSDVHGHKEEFDEMLEKIGFSDDDELYVLGDLIDKGPGSADLLIWAVDKAPSNVHFLLGNHEDAAYCVVKRSPKTLTFRRDDPWHYAKGEVVAAELKEKTTPEWREKKLLPWLEALPSFYYIEVNGKPFMLTHAGFDPGSYEGRPEDERDESEVEETKDDLARRQWLDVGHGFGRQYSQDMLYIRTKWIYDRQKAPMDVVHGHTPLDAEDVIYISKKYAPGASGGGGQISHIFNKHIIDCGCSHSSITYRPSNLGCLRLDDMEEFYVPAIPYDSDAAMKKLGKIIYEGDPGYEPEDEYSKDDDVVDERWWV